MSDSLKHFADVLLLLSSSEAFEPSRRLEQLLNLASATQELRDEEGVTDAKDADDLCRALQPYFVHANRGVRAAAVRAWRYCMKRIKDVEEVMDAGVRNSLHFHAVRSLERSKEFEIERAQVVKLIAQVVEISPSCLPRALVQSLVAVAEHADDAFRRPCLEVLCEVTIRNPTLAFHCGGLGVLCEAALDIRVADIQESILLTLQYVLSDVSTRRFVRPTTRIDVLLSPFTNTLGNVDDKPDHVEHSKQLKMARSALVTMARSWSGLLALASDENGGLRSVVKALELESRAVRTEILAAIQEIFGLSCWGETPEAAKTTQTAEDAAAAASMAIETAAGRVLATSLDESAQQLPPRSQPPHDLVSNYMAVVLLAFINAGVVDALMAIAREGDATESRQCTHLLAELLDLANALMPPMMCAQLQSLPSLVLRAAAFGEEEADERAKASAILGQLRQFTRRSHAIQAPDASKPAADAGSESLQIRRAMWRPTSSGAGTRSMVDRVYTLKVRLDMFMDESHFQQQLKSSVIVEVKNFRRWNLDLMGEVMEGSLQNPERFKYALHKTKFFKRILSFLRPEKKQFWTLSYTPDNIKYVKMGCEAFRTLLAHDEGRTYLGASEFVPQVAAMLKTEVEPASGSGPRIISPDNLETTMAREYFVLIGLLSGDDFGVQLLVKYAIPPHKPYIPRRHRVFDSLLRLVSAPPNPVLSRIIVSSLDYTQEGHCRTILRQCLVGGLLDVRLHATKHMRTLLRRDVEGFAQWGIALLTDQLHDPDQGVAREALSVLEEACGLQECLDSLVDSHPQIAKLGAAGKLLLLRLLASVKGLDYLKDIDVLEPEMSLWINGGCDAYVVGIETALGTALQDKMPLLSASVPLPPHFFGQLVRTVAGCDALATSGHYQILMETVTRPTPDASPSVESDTTLPLRSALWSLAHIGASAQGFQTFTANSGVVEAVARLAETSPCVAVRGTCWYALGLLSLCVEGRAAVAACGWLTPDDPHTAVAVPRDPTPALRLPSDPYVSRAAGEWTCPAAEATEGDSEVVRAVLTNLSDLSNHITADGAVTALKRSRAKNPGIFADPTLLLRAYAMMEAYRYRLPVRRFVHDLFEKVVFPS